MGKPGGPGDARIGPGQNGEWCTQDDAASGTRRRGQWRVQDEHSHVKEAVDSQHCQTNHLNRVAHKEPPQLCNDVVLLNNRIQTKE